MADFEIENYLLNQIYICARMIDYYNADSDRKVWQYWNKRISIVNDMLEEFRNDLKEKEND